MGIFQSGFAAAGIALAGSHNFYKSIARDGHPQKHQLPLNQGISRLNGALSISISSPNSLAQRCPP